MTNLGTSQQFDVCVVGSANLDLVVHAARHPSPGETVLGDAYHEFPGGKGLNQAVAAARAGARTAMVGALGTDAAGDRLDQVLVADGIARDGVRRVDAPTGRALITVSEDGENSIVVVSGANGAVTGSHVPPATVVLLQLEIPMSAVDAALKAAAARGATTVLNPAPATELTDDLLAAVDVLVPNEHELALVGGADVLIDRGVRTLVVTRGAAGVEIVDAQGSRHVPALPVDVVDTTGAGDAFCGMLCARLAAGDYVDEAVRWAAAAGALATTRHGAVPSIPSAADVGTLLETTARQ